MNAERLNDLVSQLSSAYAQAEQDLQKFEKQEVDISQVNEHLKRLNEIEGQFSIEVGSIVRDYYQAIIKIKRSRAINELGYAP